MLLLRNPTFCRAYNLPHLRRCLRPSSHQRTKVRLRLSVLDALYLGQFLGSPLDLYLLSLVWSKELLTTLTEFAESCFDWYLLLFYGTVGLIYDHAY